MAESRMLETPPATPGTSQNGSDSRQSWEEMGEGRHSQPPSEEDLGSQTEYGHSRSAPIGNAAGIRDPLHFLRDEALNNQREIILELRMLRHCLDRAELRADLRAQDVLYAIVELRRQVSSDGARQRYLLFAGIFAAMLVSSLASSFLIRFLNW